MERLTTVFQHLNAAERAVGIREVAALPTYLRKADDIVVVSALRTPITRAKRGSFKVSCTSFFSVFKIIACVSVCIYHCMCVLKL